jgi:hypothetical protein
MTKSKLQVKEFNCETGEEIVRDATAEEIAQMQKDAAAFAAEQTAIANKAIAKQAILDRIGLTADELKTILG